MQTSIPSRLRPFRSTCLLAALALAGCSNDEPEPEPAVATLRLVVGTQTIEISENGTVTGGPITVGAGQTLALTASFLKADGTAEDRVSGAEFEVRVVPAAPATVTFTRTGAFAGNLVGGTVGSTTMAVSLYHLVEMHDDFGPFNVPVTVS